MGYREEYARSINDPENFWRQQAALLEWITPPATILAPDQNGAQRWFPDGVLNTAWLCLDRHVESGRADQVAIYYDSPVTGRKEQFTYRALRDKVATFAGALRSEGVHRGDRVVIYMPMVPEAVIAMLACARLGAIHSVVFGGFAPRELATRIDDAKPVVIVSASCGFEVDRVIKYKPLLDQALAEAAHRPSRCIILQRPQSPCELTPGRDLDYQDVMARAKPADCVPVAATDPLYILYTSGTTGKPKGVVRDNGGHAVALRYSMKMLYDLNPGDTWFVGSDIGWVVGHSYIVYGPLLAGCSSVMYEGKPVRTPNPGAFWRLVEEYKCKAIFAAPTAFRAIRKEDQAGEFLKRHDVKTLKTIFMAGERLDPATYEWTAARTGVPVVDHWWQTETGWAICGNPMGIEPHKVKPGSATLPMPGFDVRILDPAGEEVPASEHGSVAIKLPLPPSCLPTIWGDHAAFVRAYLETFPGYYLSGDGGYKDDDGYVFIMGRTDDVINTAGHRLSTGEIEQVVASHAAVAECVVVGVACELRGQVPMGLVVLRDGAAIDAATLEQELIALVRERIGAFACFKSVTVVKSLPKTRSGKILRRIIRNIADGVTYVVPPTIEDAGAVDAVKTAITARSSI